MLVIAIVALLVFGPDRLPEIARTAAKAIARFRSETQRGIEELKRAAEVEDLERELRDIKRDLTSTGTALRGDVERNMRAGLAAASPSTALRADHDPPPVDLQAT